MSPAPTCWRAMVGSEGARIVAAARACIDTPFRLQGRVPGLALDCVGLVAVALAAVRPVGRVPADYRLDDRHDGRIDAALHEAGLCRSSGAGRAGDVVEMRPGPGQRHLGIWTGATLIHAHAGLGRVVETPGWPQWPVAGFWRRGEM